MIVFNKQDSSEEKNIITVFIKNKAFQKCVFRWVESGWGGERSKI